MIIGAEMGKARSWEVIVKKDWKVKRQEIIRGINNLMFFYLGLLTGILNGK